MSVSSNYIVAAMPAMVGPKTAESRSLLGLFRGRALCIEVILKSCGRVIRKRIPCNQGTSGLKFLDVASNSSKSSAVCSGRDKTLTLNYEQNSEV